MLFSLLVGSAAALLLPLPAGWSAGWRGECLNRLHVPLMGFCCLALVGLFRTRTGRSMPAVLLAALSASLLAACVEFVQPWFHRTADIGDFMWGLAGVFGGALWAGAPRVRSSRLRLIQRFLALVILLSPPLAWASQVFMARQSADSLFPVLTDFTGGHGGFFWSLESGTDSFNEQITRHGHLILRRTGQTPASAHLDTLDRDWTPFDHLEIDGTLEASKAVEIGLRLDLTNAANPRLRAGGWMTPGRHTIQIRWPDSAPARHVHQMVVFLAAGEPAATLHIHQLRLVRHESRSSP